MQSAIEMDNSCQSLTHDELRALGHFFDNAGDHIRNKVSSPPTNRYYVGMKVEVGIPLPDAQTFRDWAIINEMDEDLVSLQLSRDILPDGVSLRVGQLLTMRSERDGQVHSCRCFIVGIGYDHELLLRLAGEIFSGEMREFFRVDAFLPIKYHRLHGQNPAVVKKQWEARRRWRQEEKRALELRRLEAMREKLRHEERARKLKLLDGAFSGEPAGFPQGMVQEEPQDNQYDELSASAKTVAVTIGGGGLKIPTSQKFDTGEFVLLEIFVPSSRLVADVVARVVFSGHSAMAGEERSCFDAGMQFVFIDESARHAINSHICSIQLKRIRHFKGFADAEPLYVDNISESDNYADIDEVDAGGPVSERLRIKRRPVFQHLALGLFFVCAVTLISFFYSGYVAKHPNEIQNNFEQSIALRGTMMSASGR
jgi:hypothetical protein